MGPAGKPERNSGPATMKARPVASGQRRLAATTAAAPAAATVTSASVSAPATDISTRIPVATGHHDEVRPGP
jgi:hypothetical protein